MKLSKYLLCSVFFCLIALFLPRHIQAADWLSGFSYRKELTLQNSSGSDLTNYQIEFTLNQGTGTDSGFTLYLDNNVQASFDDIRFTTSDGTTVLDYWIESISSGTATVWVEFDTLSSSTNSTFYLYYGNSTASPLSSGTNTFHLFEFFDINDADNWTGAIYNNHAGESASHSLSTSLYATSAKSVQLTTYANCNLSPWNGVGYRLSTSPGLSSGNYKIDFQTRRQITGFRYPSSGTQSSLVEVNGTTQYNTGTSCSGLYCTANSDWIEASITLTNTAINTLSLLAYSSDCLDGYTNFDNVLIRSYVADEPTLSAIGDVEEPAPDPTPSPTASPTATAPSSTSTSEQSACNEPKPSEIPSLHSLVRNERSITLYFTPVKNNNTGYVISYGSSPDASEHATSFDWSDISGMVPYTISEVDSNSSWYFKVRGKNGCAVGDWSNTLSALLPTPIVGAKPIDGQVKSSNVTLSPPTPPIAPALEPSPSPVVSVSHEVIQDDEAQAQKPALLTTLTQGFTDSWSYLLWQLDNQHDKFTASLILLDKVYHEQNASLQNKLALTKTALANIWLDQTGTTISNVRVRAATATTATIEWKTNHVATSKVNWGSSYDYGLSREHTQLTTDHQITIDNLEPGKTYYYEVMSQGKNYVFDARHEFVTPVE